MLETGRRTIWKPLKRLPLKEQRKHHVDWDQLAWNCTVFWFFFPFQTGLNPDSDLGGTWGATAVNINFISTLNILVHPNLFLWCWETHLQAEKYLSTVPHYCFLWKENWRAWKTSTWPRYTHSAPNLSFISDTNSWKKLRKLAWAN